MGFPARGENGGDGDGNLKIINVLSTRTDSMGVPLTYGGPATFIGVCKLSRLKG
jgi:hypothetical protein